MQLKVLVAEFTFDYLAFCPLDVDHHLRCHAHTRTCLSPSMAVSLSASLPISLLVSLLFYVLVCLSICFWGGADVAVAHHPDLSSTFQQQCGFQPSCHRY